MKKVVFIIVALIVVVGFWTIRQSNGIYIKSKPITPPGLSSTPILENGSHFIFVPYWSFNQTINSDPSDSLIYFALVANEQGVDTTDSGYSKIASFRQVVSQNAKTYLAIQMTNSEANTKILQDKDLQDRIIKQSIEIAQNNNFQGIVIDFETSSLSFDTVTNRISTFIEDFASQAHAHNLLVATALYGDTYYRVRPYNVAKLASDSDTILVMAYDFTKARNDPGPNFPLSGQDTYGYDFKSMVSDFKKDVSGDKLTIVFGMFGYDWPVDHDGKSTDSGIARSDRDIDQKFISNCAYQKCSYVVEQAVSETKVDYTADDSTHHIIWFENASSVARKKAYLESQGISSIGYWAYSYY